MLRWHRPKNKQAYESVLSRAKSLQAAIKSQAAWQWCNDEKNLGGINAGIANVEEAMTNFAMDFMAKNLKELRAEMDPGAFEASCATMANSLEPLLKALEVECKSVLSMQQARVKAHGAWQ